MRALARDALIIVSWTVGYCLLCLATGADLPPLWVPLNAPAEEHEHIHEPEPPRTERSIALERVARDASNNALENGACTFCEWD